MRFLHLFVRVVAWLPVVAAGLWSCLAARFPEPMADRSGLGEMVARWSFAELNEVQGAPVNCGAQAWLLGLLHIPGVTLEWAVLGNAFLALLLAVVLTGYVRRAFALDAIATAWVRLVLGLLVCSPAFGVDWLYAQRAGLFMPPLLFVLAAGFLQRDRAASVRILGAMLLAAAAPFCHSHGVVVFAALLPCLLDATRRSGSTRTGVWVIAWLVIGGLAAIASMVPAGGVALPTNDLVDRMQSSPLETFYLLLDRLGAAWLDGLPGTGIDERVLGAVTLLLPLVVWRLGDRSDAARRPAALGWSCLWFGLLLTAWQFARHGAVPAVGTVRELSVGMMLLPVGAVVLLAARYGMGLLPLGAGALVVLALQDWHGGIDTLRLARLRVESREVMHGLPEAIVKVMPATPMPPAEQQQLQLMQERGWSPMRRVDATLLTEATTYASSMPSGWCAGGDSMHLQGTVRSALLSDTVQVVVITSASGGEPAQVVGAAAPEFVGQGRNVAWSVALTEALPEGARVRAIGVFTRRLRAEQLGPLYVVREGKLVLEEKG